MQSHSIQVLSRVCRATARPALQLASGQAAWGCFYNYPTNAILLLFASSLVPMMGS